MPVYKGNKPLLTNTKYMASKVSSKAQNSQRKTTLLLQSQDLSHSESEFTEQKHEAFSNHKCSLGSHDAWNHWRTISTLLIGAAFWPRQTHTKFKESCIPCDTHSLSSLVAQGPKFYLGKFHRRSTFGVTGYMLLWLIAFPEPLRNPCPEDTFCYGNCLVIIPILPNCFLDLHEPLILYYDSQCLNHAQPFLEAALRRNLHRVVKIVDFVHLTVYKCVINERTCHVSFLHHLI